ncbi:MAG: 30S ribosomal protein S1 [Candidatus Pelagibacter sp.]|nr:30S ribosomal protein S1 [Candidatus Pelagibacter sp.]OUV96403.1 MAG: 30S ribosomal protein S1 [Candidatus Pelagibacter sp. TMED142]
MVARQNLKIYNSNSNQEFEKLLNDNLTNSGIVEHTIVKGTIEKIEDKYITVYCVGAKSSGVIEKSEIPQSELDTVEVGKEIEVYVERTENRNGEIVLSIEKARRARSWKKIKDAFEKKEKVSGVVQNMVKGGYIIEVEKIFAFCPSSQLSDRPIKNASEFIRKPLEFLIIKIDPVRMNVIVSRRAILEEEKNLNKDQVISNYKEKDIIEGRIKAITSYGLFVSIETLDCLLHSSEVSWLKISNLNDMFTVGDTLKCQVLEIDKEAKRMSLSIRSMYPDPFKTVSEKYTIGKEYEVKIIKLTDWGAFAELSEGVSGLIHSSEIKHMQKNVNPKSVFKINDEVKVKLKEVNTEKRKISLSYKDCLPNPIDEFIKKYPIGTVCDAKIVNKKDFGLFLNTGNNEIDIFVHYKQLSFSETSKDLDEYNKNDSVKLKIIDIKDGKVNGSIRALKKDPFSFFESKKEGSVVSVRVVEIQPNAIKVNVGEDRYQTLIKKADIALEKKDCSPSRFAPGDTLDAVIVEISNQTRKVKLSIKEYEKQQQDETLKKYGSTTSGQSLAGVLGAALKKKSTKKKKS